MSKFLTTWFINVPKDESKLHVLTIWLALDLESEQGRELLRGALTQLKSSTQMRIGLIHNTEKPDFASKLAFAAFESQKNNQGIRNILSKVFKEDTLQKLIKGKKKLEDFDIPGADMEQFIKIFKNVKNTEEIFDIHRIFNEKVLSFETGQNGLIVNGRILGPLSKSEVFGSDDFSLLDKFSISSFGEKLVNALYNNFEEKTSDLAMKLSSLLVSRPETSKTRSEIQFYADKLSVLKLDPEDPKKPSFDLVAIFDPLSKGAQKITATLQVLRKVVNAKIRIFFNCVDKHSEMPQKSYFRLVLENDLNFGLDGSLSSGPMAKFNHLPEEPIFTMHYHIPDNWLIGPVKSVYDLDNIKLANVEGSVVHSEFELEYLLLEGNDLFD